MYTLTVILKDSHQLVNLTYDNYENAIIAAGQAVAKESSYTGLKFFELEDDYKNTAFLNPENIAAISISNFESMVNLERKRQKILQRRLAAPGASDSFINKSPVIMG